MTFPYFFTVWLLLTCNSINDIFYTFILQVPLLHSWVDIFTTGKAAENLYPQSN